MKSNLTKAYINYYNRWVRKMWQCMDNYYRKGLSERRRTYWMHQAKKFMHNANKNSIHF